MRDVKFVSLIALIFFLGLNERSLGDEVFHIGDKAQLFVDRLLVAENSNVTFTQHPGRKHPANPLLVTDQPWEGWRLALFGDVIWDAEERVFKMWYASHYQPVPNAPKTPSTNLFYATSKDGVHWDKPLLTPVEADQKLYNLTEGPGRLDSVSVFKFPDAEDPSERYKMVAFVEYPQSMVDRADPHGWHNGYKILTSPDGLKWQASQRKPLVWDVFDMLSCIWDPHRELYVLFYKDHMMPWMGHNRRLFYTMTSPDLKAWSTPVLSWTVDRQDDATSKDRLDEVRPLLDRPDNPSLMRTEYYGIAMYPHESLASIGFAQIFTINNNARFGNQDGVVEIQLGVSRDLTHWDRPFRQSIIPRGSVDEWDSAYFYTASHAMRVGDEVWLYFAAGNYTHGTPALYHATDPETGEDLGRGEKYTSSIGLVTWPLDRFVSVDSGPSGGELVTKPLVFEGDRLELNADVTGRIRVTVTDPQGVPIDGFQTSDVLAGDDLRHVVKFNGNADVSGLAGRPIVLRFVMEDAELYGFAFRRDGRNYGSIPHSQYAPSSGSSLAPAPMNPRK